MSKLWKGVKKTFKKVKKFVKKHWKKIAIAAAVYFTAGIALGAMPATASFSAAMPGFGTGGIFAKAAVSLGFTGAAGSGIAGTVAANAAATAAAAGASAAAGGSGLGLGGVAPTLGSAGGMPGAIVSGAGKTAGLVAKTASGMSALEKIALLGTAFKGVSGLLSDSQDDVNEKQHNRNYGQSYGIGRDGQGPGYGGLVEQKFGDMFGGQNSGQQQSGQTSTPQGPGGGSQNYVGNSPFKDMDASEQAASSDKSFFDKSYGKKPYV